MLAINIESLKKIKYHVFLKRIKIKSFYCLQ